jgi:hypothetical protein
MLLQQAALAPCGYNPTDSASPVLVEHSFEVWDPSGRVTSVADSSAGGGLLWRECPDFRGDLSRCARRAR